jgi:type IV pilus assembly protein PilW
MRAYKRHTNEGFTIIEVMIAVALSSILLTAVYQTFHSQQRSYTMQSEAAAMEQNLRGSLYLLVKELRSAGYNPTQATTDDFRFVTSFPAPNNLFTVNYTDDHFTVAFTLDTCDGTDVCGVIESNRNEQIAYKFDKTTKTLQRFNDAQPDITKKWEIVANNIDAAYFRYFDQNQNITTDSANIEYVEIALLARMGKQDGKYKDKNVYTTKDGDKLCPLVSDSCVNDAFEDHYHRRLLTTTIQIRNKLFTSS